MKKKKNREFNKITEKTTDEELVAKTLKNPEIYALLVERYEKKLLRYIMRILSGTKEDAEDILQDVFLSAYKNLNDFDQDLKFSSWIYRIAHNKVISHFRKVTARPKTMTYEGDSQLLNILASEEDIAKSMEKRHDAAEVRDVLDELDEKYREALVLKFLEEKDYKEISDILEKPMGTVATLINRAKKQFKEKVEAKQKTEKG
ncbi:MAG TPA: RNA polymerase sigma factor [Candidatus Moranbacteria bacterium]|nr:RNA polymerase sigma factor [Candidatus Moranbacteria bacterium]HRY27525.1 RNA polymerase sigma factor [Candidatus Moranbacteria bacterium]HSA07754.1 RNA polymerase sigma factor [Candidatus Moranbacteria bacterium]